MWLGVHFVTINNNAYERISTKKIKTMPKIAATKHILIIIVAYWKKK